MMFAQSAVIVFDLIDYIGTAQAFLLTVGLMFALAAAVVLAFVYGRKFLFLIWLGGLAFRGTRAFRRRLGV